MGILERWRAWWTSPQRRLRRAAERELDALFRDPARLAGTSLRPEHRGRCQILDLSEAPRRIGFGIVRHPRPYPFSRQHHQVVELWILDLQTGRAERFRGINLSRASGGDGEPPAVGPDA
jgi:hypothetical protein